MPPIVLALPPHPPHGKEGWPRYRRRMGERLEPVQREASRRLGLSLSPLFAANALHGAASEDALCELRRGGLGTGVPLVEWGGLVPASQMDDVVLEIGLATAFEFPRVLSGRGVSVAVLDSGIDARHPFLTVAESVSTCPEPASVPGHHGTHCAGVIASRSFEHPGIAPGVRLLDVKVADAAGNTSPGWLAQGIDEALDRGADVLSISFGLNRFPRSFMDGHGWVCDDGRCVLCRAVDHAMACGALVVAAVGNGHLRAQTLHREGLSLSPGIGLLCPGQARGALAVGALDKAPFADRLYPRSSRGPAGHGAPKPDLVAPGVDVLSTVPVALGDHGATGRLFGFGSGTSVATAVVAGALALLVERRRAQGLPCSPAEVRNELLGRCVRPLDAIRSSNGVGAGVLDLSGLRGKLPVGVDSASRVSSRSMDVTVDPPGDSDHAYFQAVEEIFVQMRGSPLLLSPADWHVARRWHREGIPLDLIQRALAEAFAKRKERGARGKPSSLRYFAPAVEAAWGELRDLTAPGHREEAPSFEVPPRLASLAASLPVDLPRREALATRITALGGSPQEVEERLSALDREMLDAAENGLDEPVRAEILAAVEKTLVSLGGRLPAEELERSRDRLARQALRRRLGLPVLSLFSPEAERGGPSLP